MTDYRNPPYGRLGPPKSRCQDVIRHTGDLFLGVLPVPWREGGEPSDCDVVWSLWCLRSITVVRQSRSGWWGVPSLWEGSYVSRILDGQLEFWTCTSSVVPRNCRLDLRNSTHCQSFSVALNLVCCNYFWNICSIHQTLRFWKVRAMCFSPLHASSLPKFLTQWMFVEWLTESNDQIMFCV